MTGDLRRLASLSDSARQLAVVLDEASCGWADDDDAFTSRRDVLVRRLLDHIAPRLDDVDAPAVVVVGGSTGAGKSTIVNSLVGAEVSRPGVLRPTTSNPVLVCHPDAYRWFEDGRVLGSFARSTVGPGQAGGTTSDQGRTLDVVTHSEMATELAIIDAPDIDSVVVHNRELADELLGAADLWMFVTTAARYSDAVPWTFLEHARHRRVEMVVVVNRIPAGALDEIVGHMTERLSRHGFDEPRVIGIVEQPLVEGLVPREAIAELRSWLDALSSDREARAAAVARSISGALSAALDDAETLADQLDERAADAAHLVEAATDAYDDAAADIARIVGDGSLLHGEVLSRWHDMVGTGELVRQLQSTIGRARDAITATLTGRTTARARFDGAIESGLAGIVRAHAAEAAHDTAARWRAHPVGRRLLDAASEPLDRPSSELPQRLDVEVRAWQRGILDMLKAKGAGKRRSAKALSYGVNGLAAVLMVAVFAQTGGLTGAEVAIAGGSSAVGQRLLQALLGDQVIRDLATAARLDLERRVGSVLSAEASRFVAVVPDNHSSDAAAIRAATAAARAALDDGGRV